MALENFIKTVWIAAIMKSLEKAHVFASVANKDYQGTIVNLNDEVKINMISDPTIRTYTKNADITAAEDLSDAQSTLKIDQSYYFNFKANDVEAIQAKATLLKQATDKAAYGFRDKVDAYFAGLYAQAGYTSYATGTTPWEINSLNVEDVLLDAAETFGSKNVPREGRFMIVPEWFHTKLVFAGLATKAQNDALYANGFIQNVLGWDIMLSNNVSEASANTDCRIICGIKGESLSFADSVNNVEAYRPEKRFEDAVKGLYIFGGKIIRPDKTLVIHATKKAEA